MFLLSIVTALAALTVPVFPYAIPQSAGLSGAFASVESGLDVKLSCCGNTRVGCTITNGCGRPMRIFRRGNFFDRAPVHKFWVSHNGRPVQFQGIVESMSFQGLNEDDFITLQPNQTWTGEWELGEIHDMGEGGQYKVNANGYLPIAEVDGTQITGRVHYTSNDLELNVNGTEAMAVHKASVLRRRTEVVPCQGQYQQALQKAVNDGAALAKAALGAIDSDPELFYEYFRSNDQQAKRMVKDRFQAIAQEMSGGRKTKYHCHDDRNFCRHGTVAYAMPDQNVMYTCPMFYEMEAQTNTCGQGDRAMTVLHELTHCSGVYNPFTEDYAYGYQSLIRLGPQQGPMNADSHSFFARAASLGCRNGRPGNKPPSNGNPGNQGPGNQGPGNQGPGNQGPGNQGPGNDNGNWGNPGNQGPGNGNNGNNGGWDMPGNQGPGNGNNGGWGNQGGNGDWGNHGNNGGWGNWASHWKWW